MTSTASAKKNVDLVDLDESDSERQRRVEGYGRPDASSAQARLESRSQEACMFLLNNIYNRAYDKLYPKLPRVVFDISKSQLANVKNADWAKIAAGSIVCVVNSSRKISTFWRIDGNFEAVLDGEVEFQHVITGTVVAKAPDLDMTPLLNKFKVSLKYLPKNQFSIGFNVADMGTALDDLEVTVRVGQALRKVKLGSL